MRSLTLAFLAVAATLVVAPAAGASVAGHSLLGEAVVYAADPGEVNDVTVSFDGANVVFDDPGATITPQRDCTAISAHRVTCTPTQNTLVSVELADGDDHARVVGASADHPVYLDGQQGADELTGSESSGGLSGGPGHDVMRGGSGTETINAVNGRGDGSQEVPPTVLPDADTITCVAHPDGKPPIGAEVDSLDTVDGPCGEVTRFADDGFVEARGTDGPDLLSASYYPTRLFGLGGDDRLFGGVCSRCRTDGGAGNDTLEGGGLMLGGDGDDHFSSELANGLPVRQDGGPGNDVLMGGNGADRLVGGPGVDSISGGAGNDYIDARDGEADTVDCGLGRDTVVADKVDTLSGCEKATRAKPSVARAAAAASKCRRSSTTGGATVVARTSKAVVFKKHKYSYYACLYSGGKIARLLDEGGGLTEKGGALPKFAGRYVAYATRGSAIGDEFDRIVVWDMRAGRVLERAGSTYIQKIVLKQNGAVAWSASSIVAQADFNADPATEVHVLSPADDLGDLLLDRGDDVDGASLAPGSGGATITWRRGGATRSADWH